MTYPQRGCYTCKSRRLKCDSVRPRCGRCRKSCRDCTWKVNEDTGLAFKSENAFAEGRPRRPRKPAQVATPPYQVETTTSPESASSGSDSILPALSTEIEVQALNYWVENYVIRQDDLPETSHAFVTYVLPQLEIAGLDSSLRFAFLASAHAVFGRKRGVNRAIADSQLYYVKSIKITSQQINNASISDDNISQVLLTVMLMAHYESLVYGLGEDRRPSEKSDAVGSRMWTHYKGATALLKLQQQRGLNTKLPIFRVVRSHIIRTCILQGIPMPDGLEDGSVYGEEGPVLVLDILLIRVAALRAKTLSLVHNMNSAATSSGPVEYVATTITEARELDLALAMWARRIPEGWMFRTSDRPCLTLDRQESLEGDMMTTDTYPTDGHAAIWNRYRAARLIANSIHMRLLSLLQRHGGEHPSLAGAKSQCQQNLDTLARDVGRSVPFFTGHKDPESPARREAISTAKAATPFAWPLSVAVSTEGITDRRRERLKEILMMIAEAKGDATLKAVAEGGDFRF